MLEKRRWAEAFALITAERWESLSPGISVFLHVGDKISLSPPAGGR